MIKKSLKFISQFILFISLVLALALFVAPKISTMPWFAKYDLLGLNDKKTVIVNKTEKITVQENFSLKKVAENTLPSMVKIIFEPIKQKKNQIILPVSQSGIILSSDGVVVTSFNNHDNRFIGSKYKTEVFLNNGEIAEAKVMAIDNFNNLVFLKIDKDNLPVAPFGETDTMENGEKTIIVGYSQETNEQILTSNLIEEYQKNFNINGAKFIFSDENSSVLKLGIPLSEEFIGGAIIDFRGSLVGIINQRSDHSGRKHFFVTPIENIQNSFQQLIQNKKISYPKLGIYYLNITPALTQINNLSSENGALVYTPSGQLVTIKGSRGRQAGLRFGDIILKVNNEEITTDNTLSMILSKYRAEDKLELEVKRQDKIIQVKL